jgi:hypothetical protein
MTTLLRRVGFEVVSIFERYPNSEHENIKDPTWIALCGENDWVAISGDKRLEFNPENKHAVIESRCRVFILSDSNSYPEEWAAAVIVGNEKIQSVVRKNIGPFYAHIGKRANSHVSNAKFPNPAEIEVSVTVTGEELQSAEKGQADENDERETDSSHPHQV